ncbi:kinase-like protein [Rhizopus microsporus ATCC 52813]|uniref:non-specific serine/threonine protein kinase n=1 Tax=Rhizopus microsporus ATCC 52813 TaxID=1340429 RepID=A0A2G4T5S1_RHIZD|nr:kinase-like protein [Rhizopus microsporus ATCC 52813]PHZ16362.1 kinase-like protein [Rhizopus microsporus ATCC 52813]
MSNSPKPSITDNNTFGVECASFDSIRTDLSIGSKDVIVAEQWLVLGRIGEGSFGEVFEAEDIDTGRKYAIKREPLKMRHPQIKHESIIYDVLAGGPGIPQCHWHGQHDEFDCIVIDLLGPNLNQLKEVTTKLPVDVVIDFGCQMVTIIEHIHKRGLVYRDVKPDNFLFPAQCILPEPEMIESTDDQGTSLIKYRYPTCDEIFQKWNMSRPKLHIVDFGLTTWYKDPVTNKIYPESKKNYKNKTGTARYASLNVHRGKSHARRDDIESIGYLILDLVFGTLPWAGIQARNSRAGWDKMKQIKQDTFMSDLCAGLPEGFLKFIEYAQNIKFAEEPNYELLRQFLQGSLPGGKYSDIVRSPFGGHTEQKWLMNVEKDPALTGQGRPANPNRYQEFVRASPQQPRRRKQSYGYHENNDEGLFHMDDLANAINDLKSPSRKRQSITHRRTSKDSGKLVETGPSSFQKLVAKTRRKQRPVGWNSHRHENEPWNPVTDWEATSDKNNKKESSWGEDNLKATWGNKEGTWGSDNREENTWAASVQKPWEQ